MACRLRRHSSGQFDQNRATSDDDSVTVRSEKVKQLI